MIRKEGKVGTNVFKQLIRYSPVRLRRSSSSWFPFFTSPSSDISQRKFDCSERREFVVLKNIRPEFEGEFVKMTSRSDGRRVLTYVKTEMENEREGERGGEK